jgi:hypothetical protein
MSEKPTVHPSAHFGPPQERIRDALAKAKRLLSRDESLAHEHEKRDPCSYCGDAERARRVVNLGEVALAGAMWEAFVQSPDYNGAYTSPPAALVAFAEKVDGL